MRGNSDVSWLHRAARVVPVIAGAALLGGMIGGFAMFAIDSALNGASTWEPNPQPRAEARADNQASAVNPQTTKPVRVVGGAIPDPSAGMSAPPPAPQQQRSGATPAQSQISSQLLAPKPLGPESALQPQSATMAAAQTPSATRWPDALSRAHQNTENPANEQQHTTPVAASAPPATAQTSERAANKNSETDRNEVNSNRAPNADDQAGADSSRYRRHSRRHAWRYGGGDDASTAMSPLRRQDARSYDQLYDSYGNRRNRSSNNRREQSYGDVRDNQDDAASRSDLSRSDLRRFRRDTRYRGRSRMIDREQPEENDRSQAFEAARPRHEPF